MSEFPESLRKFLDSADCWLVGERVNESSAMDIANGVRDSGELVLIGVFSTFEKAFEIKDKGRDDGRDYFVQPIHLDEMPVRIFHWC